MAYFPAKDLILLIQDSLSPSQYVSIAALRNVQMQIANSEEDVTAKGDNQFGTLYPQGALKTYTVSGEFVLTDANGFTDLQAAAESANPQITAKLDDGSRIYSGAWQITQWQVQGGAFGAVQGSVTLRSTGTITAIAS